MLIEVQSLSHTYASGTSLARRALSSVDLRIRPGERVGIIGETGSGKSTLVQHLAGLLKPTSGQVLLDGVPAHGRSAAARARRRSVSIAFQYPEEQIFQQTVFGEVAFGPRNMGLKGDDLADRVRWALSLVGLDPSSIVDRSPFALSGGETRRLALASVLAMRPQVLILDEPTAGLDPRGRAALIERIRAWPGEQAVTSVIISHDIGCLASAVNRLIVLREGKVKADGPARRILTDSEALSVAGLRPPAPVALLCGLRQAGWPVRTDRITLAEAASEIANVYSRRNASDQTARYSQ